MKTAAISSGSARATASSSTGVEGEPGNELVFPKVLLITGDGEPTIGAPVVEGARVTAKVVNQFRDKKIIIQKFRRRKNMRRRNGHRQPYTTVLITGIATA